MEDNTKGDEDSASYSSTPEKLTLKDEKELDLRYGCLGCKPRWLQWLNTIGGFVAWLSLANCFQSMANGLIGVIMSTLEKRFDFSSTESSWIASAYEMGPIPVVIVISYFGNRIHRPLSCAIGMLVVAVGCVMFFIPQFTTPAYRPSEEGDQENVLCNVYSNRSSRCDVNAEDLSNYLPLFVVARLLIGMGSTPILTLGVTYMDDCSHKGKFATYTGIFNAMSVIGPALSYVCGGLMLNIFVDFYAVSSDEVGITSEDSRWIGAWWLPYTIAAGISLLNAIPMFGYPRDLPGAAEIRRTKVSEAHKDEGGEANPAQIAVIKTWVEFKKLFRSVFTNPAFIGLTVFTCCDNFLIAGFTAYGPKVFEVAFTLTAAVAGGIFGIVLMPAGAGGTIVGGVVIEKMKLSCRQIIRVQTVLCAIVTAGICLLLIVCNPLDFAGVNMSYQTNLSSSDNDNLTDVCNVGCDCQYVAYNPVCSHDNIVYYSPCHAGCSIREDDGETTKNYYNCSCISSPSNGDSLEATSKTCSADSCPMAILFLVVFFFAVGFIFVCLTMNMAATLRCVSSSQTSFAFGVQFLFGKLCGTMLGPIFMGMAFDNSCVLWQHDECGARGNCLFYDNKVFAVNLTVICFTVKLVSLVAMIMTLIFYKPPESADILVKEVPPSVNQVSPITTPGYDDDVKFKPGEIEHPHAAAAAVVVSAAAVSNKTEDYGTHL